jgi:hypothetical protein
MALGLKQRVKEGDKPTPTRVFSKIQETAVAKAIGGQRTPNSGATMFGGKGDVISNKFLLECKTKTTHSESISIKREWFEKNKQEAMFMGKPYSAVVFNFGPDEENHYIIDEYLFLELLNHLNTLDENI